MHTLAAREILRSLLEPVNTRGVFVRRTLLVPSTAMTAANAHAGPRSSVVPGTRPAQIRRKAAAAPTGKKAGRPNFAEAETFRFKAAFDATVRCSSQLCML